MDSLSQARRELEEALGDLTKEYFHNLRLWFHVKISKEMFDVKSRRLLPAGQIRLHNNFLLALLNKCHLGDSVAENVWNTESVSAPKRCRTDGDSEAEFSTVADPALFTHRFTPEDPSLHASCDARGVSGVSSSPPVPADYSRLSVQRQRVLPDRALIHGRLFLDAWQLGLESVEESAVDLLLLALQLCLKNVITSVLCRKVGYQTRNGRVVHSVGRPVPNPWLINSCRLRPADLSADEEVESGAEGERLARLRLACADQRDLGVKTVSLLDLLHALKSDSSMIPCHPVYSLLLERTSARLSCCDHAPPPCHHAPPSRPLLARVT